jgi:hypothetical protein
VCRVHGDDEESSEPEVGGRDGCSLPARDAVVAGEARELASFPASPELELAQDQASATAAAHLLASEPDYMTEKNTDQRRWFPYNFIMRVEVPDFD